MMLDSRSLWAGRIADCTSMTLLLRRLRHIRRGSGRLGLRLRRRTTRERGLVNRVAGSEEEEEQDHCKAQQNPEPDPDCAVAYSPGGPAHPSQGSADPVEQPPVGLEGGLGCRDERILVLGRHHRLDQSAGLLGVGMIGFLMDLEVLAPPFAVDAVEAPEPLPLHPGDLGLSALDRVHPRELLEVSLRRCPGGDAFDRLGRGLRADLAAGGRDEVIPEAYVTLLLRGMGRNFLAMLLGSGLGGLTAETSKRLGRMTVLARVAGEFIAAQLPRRPAHVEGMLEHVVPSSTLLDPLPNRFAHQKHSFEYSGDAGRIPSGGCALRALTSPFRRCRPASTGSESRSSRSTASSRRGRRWSTSSTSHSSTPSGRCPISAPGGSATRATDWRS